MPQMAPMSWMMLFMYFSSMLVMIAIINYYLYTPTILQENNKGTPKTKSMNWKW